MTTNTSADITAEQRSAMYVKIVADVHGAVTSRPDLPSVALSGVIYDAVRDALMFDTHASVQAVMDAEARAYGFNFAARLGWTQ